MGEVSTIGFDIAKSVFQVHGVDSAGAVVVCASASVGRRCWSSLAACRRVWSGSKPVRQHIIKDYACPASVWSYGEADAAELCEGLQAQAQQERRQ